jgi:NAD+ synthetase
MALSNKFGWMLVATGNKSELSVGYATLYGDMAGGFALLKDVYKTDVFRLARHLNERAGRELIPQSIVDRAPSAELRDNQLDETRCRRTRSWTRCSRSTSSTTARSRAVRRTGSTRTWSSAPSR